MEQGWGGRGGVGKGLVGEEGLVWLEKRRDRGPHLLPGQGSPPTPSPLQDQVPSAFGGRGLCCFTLFCWNLGLPFPGRPPPPPQPREESCSSPELPSQTGAQPS